jgi:hypothetical protein
MYLRSQVLASLSRISLLLSRILSSFSQIGVLPFSQIHEDKELITINQQKKINQTITPSVSK